MFDILKLFADDDDDERDPRWERPDPPRRSMTDPEVWDSFWREQFESGLAAMVDFLCRNGELVDTMRANGLRTVLCAGSGISHEPRALARMGFDVTALDLSPLAIRAASEISPPRALLDHIVEGRRGRRGGSVRFVTGDLCDSTICPGPYDVVIDRKTLQLYAEPDRVRAMRALADRLNSPGIFFSHSHRNAPARHGSPADWFNREGWPRWQRGAKLSGRVAWFLTTSG